MLKQSIQNFVRQHNVAGKKVLVRADLNVPFVKNQTPPTIADATRIQSSLSTIELLRDAQAQVVLCSHLGRPKGKVKDELRLAPVAESLSEFLGQEVKNTPDCVGAQTQQAIDGMKNGQVLLLENLRFHPEEEKNDPAFAKQLATGMDLYVNDAFGAAHRAHASTEGVTKFIKHNVAGNLMEKELKYLYGAVEDPKRPLTAIIGGAKVSTKIPVLESLIEKCDTILLGGGMIFTFYKAQNMNVGKSIIEEDKVDLAKKIMEKAQAKGVKLLLPTDVVIADKLEENASSKTVPVTEIPDDWLGLDIGRETVKSFSHELQSSNTMVWNGPMGVFEYEQFAQGTFSIAKTLADCTQRGATTIIGGGDSVAAVKKSGLSSSISHISTGGGASLELLEGKTLPGVAALDDLN